MKRRQNSEGEESGGETPNERDKTLKRRKESKLRKGGGDGTPENGGSRNSKGTSGE